MRKIKKGSFTIEAALLMPLVLMILIGVLYLDFFVHDRAYLTAAAYEAAVSGSMEGYKKKGNIYEKADIQGRMLGDIGLPGGENLSTGKASVLGGIILIGIGLEIFISGVFF